MLQGARACARGWACKVKYIQPTSSSLPRPTPHPRTQEHWKYGGHKKACAAYVLAAAAQAQQNRLCTAAAEAEQCLICLEPPSEPTALPCGHSFCTACVVELRAKGVSDACPLCRAPLPPGPENLWELGYLVWAKIERAVDPSGTCAVDPSGTSISWPPLSASQQGEMDGAMVMLQEAADQVSGGPCSPSFIPSRRRLTSFAMSLASHQGHIRAAMHVGNIYSTGGGVAIDPRRAMAAYKVGAEGGDGMMQFAVGAMYYSGKGVEVDYKQARAWYEKAAAQDYSGANYMLGRMYRVNGTGVTPSWRRAREYYKRAIELGSSEAVKDMQDLIESIQMVTSQRSNHSTPLSLVRDLASLPITPFFPHTRRSAPSWTSRWRSTARAART